MAISVKTKEWGNSIGIILPREIVDELSISTGEELVIDVKRKQNVLKELFGSVHFKKKTDELLKEVRQELEGDLI